MPARATEYTQIPINSFGVWEGVQLIESVVDEADNGFFWNAAMLVDQILRDDRIRGVLMTRIYGVLGKPLTFEPPKDNGRHKAVVDDVEAMWPAMFEDSALVELMLWGLVLGVGLAQVVWKDAIPRLEVWHPWALKWDDYKRRYIVQTSERTLVTLEPDDYGYTDENGGQWLLFTPYGAERPGRRGLLRNLASLYMERRYVRRDRARYSEVHGVPIRFGTAPANATDVDIAAYNTKIGDLGGDASITARKGTDGNQWGLELVEAVGNSHEGFDMALAELDKAVAVLILGQSQSTDGQAGLGSNDQAGEPVRHDISCADERAISHCIRNQFLMRYVEFAWGAASRAPYPCWQVEPPEDGVSKAEELDKLGDAFVKHKTAGAPLDIRAILEDHGVPMVSEEEQARLDAEAAALEAEAAAQQAALAPASDAPLQLPAHVETKAAGARHPRAVSTHASAARGQEWAAALSDNAREAGKVAMRAHLAELMAIVKTSADFDEAKKRVVERYKTLSPAALADVVHKTQVMANLRGRLQVMETVA